METDNRITAVLAHLREGVVGIYIQKKLDELNEEFVKKIKTMFSNKTKTADIKLKIKTFKQGKQNTTDFMIDFNTLAMKTDIDELYTIFLLKKNI